MHPFPSTPGSPDMTRAIAENDPRHVTRERMQNKRKYHVAPTPIEQIRRKGALKLKWTDTIHQSHNELFLVPKCMAQPLNVCIRKANDPSLTWRFDDKGPRQSARAYTRTRLRSDPQSTQYVRIATQLEGKGNIYSTFLHPVIAAALLEHDAYVPPGDVVARWNRARARGNADEAARMHGILRDGLPICVYFE